MTYAGWIFMFGSISFVLGLVTFCFYKVLCKPSVANHMHAPIEIDTKDRESD